MNRFRLASGSVPEARTIVITPPIEPNNVLDRYETTLKQLGQSEEKIINQQETIRQLEEQLTQRQIPAESGTQQIPQPTQEAKDLAAQIEDDAGPYAQALKAIARGNPKRADELLDQTQQFLDQLQERKDQAQAKIYLARLQNSSYAGRPQDALPYCEKLKPLADDDSLTLNYIAKVYYENAQYNDAEPLMERHLVIFLEFTRRTGHPHPHLNDAINNYAALLAQMGQTKAQIAARLQSLAPEFFPPPNNHSEEE